MFFVTDKKNLQYQNFKTKSLSSAEDKRPERYNPDYSP